MKKDRIQKLRDALAEVNANRSHFSEEAHKQILLALLDQIRLLQTIPEEQTPRRTGDEIRLVTVMFADIKDSTELAQHLGTEEWKRLIAEVHTRLAAIITEWGGEVGQYLGDGLLCFFGANRSRSDDAVRAVSCALAAQQAMTKFGADFARQHRGAECAVRIGISTGRLVVGMIGGQEKQELLALGPATNLAARLQSMCPPGGVVIDDQTYHRTRAYFVMIEHPPVQIKGFDGPVEYYTVVDRRAQQSPGASSRIAGIRLPFVGRDKEMRQITRLCERAARSAEFHVVMISGEIGIGKSRLLQEIMVQTAPMPFIHLHMAATYERRGASYNLLRDLLSNSCNLNEEIPPEEARSRIVDFVCETWEHEDAETVAAVVGHLAGFGFEEHPHVQPLLRGGPGQERMAFTWFTRWLHGISGSSPMLITVDNLQWADPSSLDLLEHLAYDMEETGGILITTMRPEFHAVSSSYMQGFPQQTRIVLERLDEESATELIVSILSHVENVPESLLALINERADGNPLFVEEFLHMLFDGGVIEPNREGRWRVVRSRYDQTVSSLPSGLIGVLQARIDDLPGTARHITQIAAVVGHTFWRGAVATIAGIDPQPALDELITRGIIVHIAESSFENDEQYQFRHSLYREVAYEMLPRMRREVYHHQAATWLHERAAGKPNYLVILAEHYTLGRLYDQALQVYRMAAQHRLQRGLVDEALALVEAALGLAENVQEEETLPMLAHIWVMRGQALHVLNLFQEAAYASQTALEMLAQLPPRQHVDIRAQAARVLGLSYRSMGRYNEALEALQVAAELLTEDDPEEYATVLRSFGAVAHARGRLGESQSYLESAHHYARITASPPQLSGCLTEMGLVALDRGDFATALSYFETVLESNRQRENMLYQIMDLRNIGLVHRALLDEETALKFFDQADTLQASMQYEDMPLQAYRGLCQIALGQVKAGMELLEEALRLGHRDAYNQMLLQLAQIEGLVLAGSHQRGYELARVFVAQVQEHNPLLLGRGMRWLGLTEHALGQGRAQETLNAALEYELDFGGRDAWRCYEALARTATDPQQALAYYEEAAGILSALVSGLHTRPAIQHALVRHPLVQSIFNAAAQPLPVLRG